MVWFFKTEKSLQERVAYVVSRIFEPFLWLGFLGITILFSAYMDGHSRVFWSVELLAFLAGLPILTLWLALKKGKVKDIDFTKREERTPYILAVLFYWALGMILAWGFGGPKIIIKILFLAIVLGAAMLIINLYYKISGHALGFTISVLMINEFWGWQYWWLLFLLPVVFWSRLVQKKHTLGQLFLGVGLAVVGWAIWKTF